MSLINSFLIEHSSALNVMKDHSVMWAPQVRTNKWYLSTCLFYPGYPLKSSRVISNSPFITAHLHLTTAIHPATAVPETADFVLLCMHYKFVFIMSQTSPQSHLRKARRSSANKKNSKLLVSHISRNLGHGVRCC